MNTYLVRTKSDQTLVGIFCAASTSSLAALVNEVFDANECEYLQLKANEGLFIEAQFVTESAVAPGETDEVALVHVDGEPDMGYVTIPSESACVAAELLMVSGASEYVPPVLEPTPELHERFQLAHRKGEWRPVTNGPTNVSATPSQTHKPRTLASTNSDTIARKLMLGSLTPVTFVRSASTRYH